MSATAKRAAAVALLLAGSALAGCAASSPDDTAFESCVAFYDEHKPDGTVNAETGETYDSARVCHNMIGVKGQEYFTTFWNDPEQVEQYSRGF